MWPPVSYWPNRSSQEHQTRESPPHAPNTIGCVIQLWWQIPITVMTTVITTVLLRFVPWGRARITSDAASIARDALTQAAWVFGQSQATGGRLGHPWELTSGEIHCHELVSKLTDAHDRIKGKKFRENIMEVRKEIHGVWVTSAHFFPAVGYEGKLPTPAGIEHDWQANTKAELQLHHARMGDTATKAALAELARLSPRA